MKLASFSYQNQTSYGVIKGDQIIDLAPMANIVGATLREALDNNRLQTIAEYAETQSDGIPLSAIRFLPVIPNPAKILCVGINYLSHVKETGREIPKFPMFFTRFSDSQTAHEQALVRPMASEKLDFEGELAVVIGRKARHVKQADALSYVAGYSCYNDGSVRDWQKHTIQFI